METKACGAEETGADCLLLLACSDCGGFLQITDDKTVSHMERFDLFSAFVISDLAIRQYTIDVKEDRFDMRCLLNLFL